MKHEGFNINIYLDLETGFVFGGNQHNCGTWMDKMGSSDKTGNRGVPATPRDGAPIELVALLYTALRFMQDMQEQGLVSRSSVRLSNGEEWTYKEWADRIKSNFERCFWVPVD
jgi:glycogen debranching enzyme